MRAGWTAPVAAAVFLTVSFLGALVLDTARGPGSGDVLAFAIWSAPASLLLSGVAYVLARSSSKWRPLLAFPAHGVAGTVFGLGWTFGIAASLGGWFLAFSFPIAPIWAIAGGIACISAALTLRPKCWPVAGLATCIPVALVFTISQQTPPRPPDMLITLRQGATQDDARMVLETVICRPESGKGYRPLLGIAALGPWDVGGRKRFRIGFHRSTAAERRQQIRQSIMASDLVEAVEEIQPLE